MAIFPFGKYRGLPVSDADTSYLRWFLANVQDIDEDLAAAIEDELSQRTPSGRGRRRKRHQQQKQEQTAESPANMLQHPGVMAWRASWREICLLGHPDRGGDQELLKLLTWVNEAMNAA